MPSSYSALNWIYSHASTLNRATYTPREKVAPINHQIISWWEKFSGNSNIMFYGSRSRTYTPENYNKVKDSDWDFIVQYDSLLINRLSESWSPVSNKDYGNNSTVLETDKFGQKVQLNFKPDYNAAKIAWKTIPDKMFWQCLWKHSPDGWSRKEVKKYLDNLEMALSMKNKKSVFDTATVGWDEWINAPQPDAAQPQWIAPDGVVFVDSFGAQVS